MEPRGRRVPAAAGPELRPEELVTHQQIDPRKVGEIVPTAVVQPAFPRS
ncbi:unnamed protein product [Linum tenue]|uniref:Uncharacterized protein n=1 Tax=Linum tenue TaxID=586396 RepID=A0AAV0MTS0_9ROSI|nr:unnamed protein product [Linum tenue]